jgi:uncharacterized protein (DUF433 family)
VTAFFAPWYLKWLATGASHAKGLEDYKELAEEGILAALQWAASMKETAPSRQAE